MTTNKLSSFELFKAYGQIEILRLVKKGSGFAIYLPNAVSRALNLGKDDHNLICFIDDESNYTYIILVKDSDLAEQLRPVILQKRQQAEQIQKQLKVQLQAQRQQTGTELTEAKVIE